MGVRNTEDCFVQFVHSHGGWMQQAAYHICGNWHDAEDLVQSVMLGLYYRKRGDHQGCALTRAYVRTAMVNAYIDARRRNRWRFETAVADPPERPVERAADVEDKMVVLEAVQRLDWSERTVILLRFFADLTVSDVATALNCPEGTVTSRTHRALVNLRRTMTRPY